MVHSIRQHITLLVVVSALIAYMLAGSASAMITEQISVTSTGTPVNGGGGNMSDDGRYAVFVADVNGVVPEDTNGMRDVFVFDRRTGVTERVSVSTGDPGGQANGPSCEMSTLDDEVMDEPCISGDGRYVVFSSSASNLVSGDTNGLRDIFVRDRVNHTTERVSVSSSEVQSNGVSCYASISSDGAHVVFASVANNLVSGDTNGAADVFLRDLSAGNTYRVNLSSAGSQASGQDWGGAGNILDNDITVRISGDGMHVAFVSSATNLVSGDTNGDYDMFVRDLNSSNHASGTTERVSVSTSGQQGNGFCWGNEQIISNDGSVVVYSSFASNLDEITPDTNGQNDVFVRDRNAHTTRRVSLNWLGGESNATSNDPSVSADGSKVCFHNHADNLLPGGDGMLNLYMVNKNGTGLERLGVDSQGNPAPGWDALGFMSADGRFVSLIHIPGEVPDLSAAQAMVVDRAAITVAQAKMKPNDAPVIIGGAVVTALFDGSFYLQQDGISTPERTCGIRVDWAGEVSPGKRYVVTGVMKTDTAGERYVEATAVDEHTSGWTVDARPLGLTNKALGGSNWHYDAATGAGQTGVAGGTGLNNIGLLVKTWGKVKEFEPGDSPTWLVIDDGSAGGVRCEIPDGMDICETWTEVEVTGISSCRGSLASPERLIRTTSISVLGSTLTGRWEGAATSGPMSGAFGMLSTQTGDTVSGTMIGMTILNGHVSENTLTGSVISVYGDTYEFSLVHSANDVLSGTFGQGGSTMPLVLNRLSCNPVNPYAGRPQVVGATCDGAAIDVHWDRPVMGYDFLIYGGGQVLHCEWRDKPNFAYDPAQHIFHIALSPTIPLASGRQYTVSLEDDSTVDWHDPYGVPAWDNTTSAYSFTFTAP